MFDLSTEKTMTIKEVASILDVTDEAIKKHIRELWPELMRSRETTYLNEQQITEIKKKMRLTTKVASALTSIEIEEMTIKVIEYHQSKLKELQEENERLNQKILDDKPKVENYDIFLSAEGYQTFNEVSKILGIGRNIMMAILRNKQILLPNNTPYQKYMDKGFKVIEKVHNGIKIPQTVVNSKGIEYIKNIVRNKNVQEY